VNTTWTGGTAFLFDRRKTCPSQVLTKTNIGISPQINHHDIDRSTLWLLSYF
jgi:hypothetical protein